MAKNVVWKYLFTNRAGLQTFEMPDGAMPIIATAQGEQTVGVWAIVNPDKPKVTRKFNAVMTGFPLPENGRYLGTAMLDQGNFVVHVFEVP